MRQRKIIASFNSWMGDNVIKIRDDVYLEQTTQYSKEFTFKELFDFFIKEYIKN